MAPANVLAAEGGIVALVRSHVPQAAVLTRCADEVSFRLPRASVTEFPNLLRVLEVCPHRYPPPGTPSLALPGDVSTSCTQRWPLSCTTHMHGLGRRQQRCRCSGHYPRVSYAGNGAASWWSHCSLASLSSCSVGDPSAVSRSSCGCLHEGLAVCASAARKPFMHVQVSKEDLGIRSYGLSVTTLEEVFLRIASEACQEEAAQGRSPMQRPFTTPRTDGTISQPTSEDPTPRAFLSSSAEQPLLYGASRLSRVTRAANALRSHALGPGASLPPVADPFECPRRRGLLLWGCQTGAVARKHVRTALREPWVVVTQLAVPLLLVLAAVLFGKRRSSLRQEPPLPLDRLHVLDGYQGFIAGTRACPPPLPLPHRSTTSTSRCISALSPMHATHACVLDNASST